MKTRKAKGKRVNIPQQKPTLISQPFIVYLPQDIISEILVRLPVKTLIGFSCVSKSWLNLITNPNFIKTHLQKSSLSNNYTTHRLIFSHISTAHSCIYRRVLNSCSINFSNSNINAVLVDYPKREKTRPVSILGSCNGLVCISLSDKAICLWNPSTRKSKELPLSRMQSRSAIYGFGYDQISNDYRVVWMLSDIKRHGVSEEMKVYSLKNHSWKKIKDFPLGVPSNGRGIYVNGVLHWMLRKGNFFDDMCWSMVIVSLDLGNDNYGEIAQPCYGESETVVSRLVVGVLEGYLSIFCYFNELAEKSLVDIWAMKEYGVKDSWTKLYTIPFATDMKNYIFIPLCITMSSEILLKSSMHLYLYNPTNSKFRELKICELSGELREFVAVTYVESLVSPNIYDEVPSPRKRRSAIGQAFGCIEADHSTLVH